MIRVFSCRLPASGLYSIDFEYNEVVLRSTDPLWKKRNTPKGKETQS